jgi:death on curing protein
MIFLSAEEVIEIHEAVIARNELQGMVVNKSIHAIIARINNRISYGLIRDKFELASSYACYIAVGHAFHDANKRTAFAAMDICLSLNDINLEYDSEEIGDMIIRAARGIIDEMELAEWLRSQV